MTLIHTSNYPCSVDIGSTPCNRLQLELTLMCSSSYSTTADHSRHNSPTLKLLSPRSLPPFSAFKDDDEAVGSQEDVVFVDDGCNDVDEALENGFDVDVLFGRSLKKVETHLIRQPMINVFEVPDISGFSKTFIIGYHILSNL